MMVISYTDVPGPFIVRAEVTADNTSGHVGVCQCLSTMLKLTINLREAL